jgi:hypothetical protein
MGIDQVDRIADPADLATLQKILDDNANQTEGTIYKGGAVPPTADQVPLGKKIIYDDGAGTKRIYWKTAAGNLGFINLT